jgi:hypothetical protein
MSARLMTWKRVPALALAAGVGMLLTVGSAQAQQPERRPAQPARPAAAPATPPAGAPRAAGTAGTPAAGAPEGGEAPKVKVERGAGGKKVYRITEAIRIEGKIQKPEAFYVLQKSGIDYDWDELKQDFIPKIVDSVSRPPF